MGGFEDLKNMEVQNILVKFSLMNINVNVINKIKYCDLPI